MKLQTGFKKIEPEKHPVVKPPADSAPYPTDAAPHAAAPAPPAATRR